MQTIALDFYAGGAKKTPEASLEYLAHSRSTFVANNLDYVRYLFARVETSIKYRHVSIFGSPVHARREEELR